MIEFKFIMISFHECDCLLTTASLFITSVILCLFIRLPQPLSRRMGFTDIYVRIRLGYLHNIIQSHLVEDIVGLVVKVVTTNKPVETSCRSTAS